MPQALQTLGRYHLLDRISIGGMAEVFRAKAVGDEGFEKIVALKCILPHLAEDREFVDMFVDEARTVAQLSHANICQIFEFGQDNGVYYIALELVEGKDLKRVMEYHRLRGRPVPRHVALYVMRRTCEALDYAHGCTSTRGEPMNIVHRDISPQNILLSYGGDVKLIDFGIAKAVGRLTKTVSGSIKGKFGYMSPEQVTGRAVDRRSDIFACGTVLWELLTNTRLFKAESDLATMQQVRKAAVPPPSTVVPDISPRLDHIVLQALAREPERRYQSAGALLDDLEQLVLQSGHTCSAQQLTRWMNEQFGQDRTRAEQQARAADQRARAAADSEQPEPTEISQPDVAPEPTSLSQPGASPATVTGRGSATGTFTETEYVVVGSLKPWIVVGVLALLLVGGGVGVLLMWPRERVVKVPVPVSPEPTATSIAAQDSGTVGATAAAPAADAGSPPDAAAATTASVKPERQTPHRPRRDHAARATRPARSARPARVPAAAPTPAPAVAPPPRRAARSELGTLVVASRPWARVWVDGQDTGRNTPIPASSPLRLPPGRHTVSLLVNDRQFDFTVQISPGTTTKLIKKLPVTR